MDGWGTSAQRDVRDALSLLTWRCAAATRCPRVGGMSTVNPDEREGTILLRIRPVALVAAVLVQFLAPALAVLTWLGVLPPDFGYILLYVLVWCVVGLAAMFVPTQRSPYILAAFRLAYIGGLFWVIGIADPTEWDWFTLIVAPATYAVAVLLLVLYFLRESAIRRTLAIGVDAVATVINAPVTGMVNYVTRQRLTLKFTDQDGVERFVRVGRTGGGYAVGDTVPIRYDPTKPWSKRGIIVEGSGPTLFGGRGYSS